MVGARWLAIQMVVGVGALPSLTHIPDGSKLSKIDVKESENLARICGKATGNGLASKSGRMFPWAVSITQNGRNTLGGAIISPYHIITAAHGFMRFDADQSGPCPYKNESDLSQKLVSYGDDCLRVGQTRLSERNLCGETNVKSVKIRSVVVDHGFAMGLCQEGHDWAIVELAEPLHFDNLTAPICLPRPTQQVQHTLTAVSWGRTSCRLAAFGLNRSDFQNSDPLLRQIPMQHDPQCEAPWSDQMPTKANDYVCAKSTDPKDWYSKRTCHGDSGSGLHQRDWRGLFVLMGITSFGSAGCPPNELARFTSVQEYLREICGLIGVCYTL